MRRGAGRLRGAGVCRPSHPRVDWRPPGAPRPVEDCLQNVSGTRVDSRVPARTGEHNSCSPDRRRIKPLRQKSFAVSYLAFALHRGSILLRPRQSPMQPMESSPLAGTPHSRGSRWDAIPKRSSTPENSPRSCSRRSRFTVEPGWAPRSRGSSTCRSPAPPATVHRERATARAPRGRANRSDCRPAAPGSRGRGTHARPGAHHVGGVPARTRSRRDRV